MIKYNVMRKTREVLYKHRAQLEAGCTLSSLTDPCIMHSFDNCENAIKELKNYHTSVKEIRGNYVVEEYYVELDEYEEDELIDYEVLEFAPFPEGYNFSIKG